MKERRSVVAYWILMKHNITDRRSASALPPIANVAEVTSVKFSTTYLLVVKHQSAVGRCASDGRELLVTGTPVNCRLVNCMSPFNCHAIKCHPMKCTQYSISYRTKTQQICTRCSRIIPFNLLKAVTQLSNLLSNAYQFWKFDSAIWGPEVNDEKIGLIKNTG